jgi:excisionase family DNA binding protein
MHARENHHNTDVGIEDRILAFPRALEAGELADLLGVKKGTIYKQAKTGAIPSFRVGTSVRFDPKKMCEWYSRQ